MTATNDKRIVPPGMTYERYLEVTRDQSLKLTPEEIAAGWFFCCEWDGLLIHKTDAEASCCSCLPEEERPSVPETDDMVPDDCEF